MLGGGQGLGGGGPGAVIPATGGFWAVGSWTGRGTARGGGGKRRSEVLVLLPGVDESTAGAGGGLTAGTTFKGCR